MRLHRLVVTAFGPFPGTEQVDFDALSAAGLFLFTGPTGAGKTSLLDAVCFALYGQVPGARQQARGLRSDHAATGRRPEVVLEVTLRGRRLLVTRSPAWHRPKLRGSGTVLEHAKVLVQEVTPGGPRTLATRLDEAGLLLGDLTGLSLAQFCQVVLLPQGLFAEFLRADADKRRDLLESLFDTRRFATVESWLVGRRQEAHRALDAADRRFDGVLARVAQAAGAEPPGDLSPSTAPHWVDRLVAEARAAARSAAAGSASAGERAAAAAGREAAARRDAALRLLHADLQRQLAELTAAQPAIDAAVTELEAARTVAPLVPLLAEVARLQGQLESARVSAATAVAAVAVGSPALAATGTEGTAGLPPARVVGEAGRATREEAGALRPFVDQESEATEVARAADELRRREVEAAALAARADAWLARSPARRAELAGCREAARAAADALPGLLSAREAAAHRVAAGRRRDELGADVAAAADDLRSRTDDHQTARETVQTLAAARLAGMAAELATGLRPGEDCPVCGSLEHPRPAVAVDGSVTAAAEQEARDAEAAADVARQRAADRLTALTAAAAEARAAAGGTAEVGALEAALATAQAAAARDASLASGLAAAEQALVAFDQEHEAWARDQVARHAEASSLATRVAEQKARAEALLAAVASARGDDASVGARVDRLQRVAADLDGLSARLADVERREVAVAEALDRAESGIRARGLDSLTAVAAAARDDVRLTELDDLRRRHESARATVTARLADPELAGALERPAADPAALAADAADLAAGRDRSVARAAEAAGRASALAGLRGALAAALDERDPLAGAHRTVDALSRLAEGKSQDNRLRMSLSAYVLAARLEQVAASASERLLRMSSGRYSLRHSPEGGSGRTRGGLALRVLDAWTGVERDPGSLSGGETFSASLALALGLADVVTAEAGGALLETLFVDEGFGSLDDETLDDVMGVLDDLRDGGRSVGLVSHVADLRQRVPVQLRVDKSRRGSVVRQQAAGDRPAP